MSEHTPNPNAVGTNETALVTVTPEAVAELKRLMESESKSDLFVRLGVTYGGCSGLSYSMEFDTTRTESDRVMTVDGLEFRIDLKALVYLKGAVVEYKGGLLGSGFSFTNPNAKRSCGCGTSFTC